MCLVVITTAQCLTYFDIINKFLRLTLSLPWLTLAHIEKETILYSVLKLLILYPSTVEIVTVWLQFHITLHSRLLTSF